MSPVAEAIKELSGLILGVATLATSSLALLQAFKAKKVGEDTKKLVNDRSDQLHAALKDQGKYLGHQEAKLDARADRNEVVDIVKDVAVETAAATAAKKEEPTK